MEDPQVLKVYGKSRSSLLAEVKAGTFPPPFQNGDTNVWHSGEVLAEMRKRIAASRANPRKKVVGKHKARRVAASGDEQKAQAQPATIPTPVKRRPTKGGGKRKPAK